MLLPLAAHPGRQGNHDFTGLEVALLVGGILLLNAAILAGVFFPLVIRPMRRARAIMATGVPTTAVIRTVHRSNTRIGASRYVVRLDLDLRAPDGRTLPVSTRTVVDLLTHGPVRPGMTLPVRVDPADLTRVAVDWDAAIAAA